MTAEDYLNSIKRESVDIDRFLSKAYHADRVENNDGWTYSSELGWVLKDAWRLDGIAQGALEKSKTFYSYEAGGARKIINFREKESRIHSYGNSFTHCDQVSDGETWQENLAANFQEPIENYGVGGYGVYQAYKRMRIVEETHPAEFIILNIWSDDHFRNLDSWRSIRFGCFTSCGLTKPFLRVNVEKQECIEHENLCPTEDALYNLSDMDFLLEKFADDPVLAATLITKQNQKNIDADLVPVSFGLAQSGDDLIESTQLAHATAALYATENIINWTEAFCKETGKKLLVVLSHDTHTVRRDLLGEPRWDQSFIDFLKTKPFPFLDLRDNHLADFNNSKLDVDAYLAQFYIGHYSPAGNFFFANEIRRVLIDWLDPKPIPYI